MKEKIKKSEQTYEWALAEMQKPAHRTPRMRYLVCADPEYHLRDIAKKHHTPELIKAAVMNGHADISDIGDIPKDLMTREMYLYAAIKVPAAIGIVPPGMRDFAFLKEVISNNPDALSAALYNLRADEGRDGSRYTAEDIELAMESICPTAWTETRFEALDDSYKPSSFESEDERRIYLINEFRRSAELDGISREMIWSGLKLLHFMMQPEGEQFTSYDLARELLSMPDKPLYIAGTFADDSESIIEWDALISESTITHGDCTETEAILIDIGDALCCGESVDIEYDEEVE